MKSKRGLLVKRKDIFQNRHNAHVEASLARSNEKYRNSVAIDYRITPRESMQGWNRYSVNIGSCGKVPKIDESNNSSIQTMQSIRNTLNQLQLRIENAKEELKGNLILGKSVIEEESQEDSRTLDLISFNDSDNSHHTMENISYLKKRPHKQLQLIDLTKVKSYYKSELAKILLSNNQKAREHLIYSWKAISTYKSMYQPNPQNSQKRTVEIGLAPTKKTLVIGLDRALIHCTCQRKSEEDIQIRLLNPQGVKISAYLQIRPHAISFLKKIGKKFDVAIFSGRSKEQTDIILDELDPLGELVNLKFYDTSCNQAGNMIIKDLRVLKRDLSSVILVDSNPCSYLQQLNNGVPLLPFNGGTDSELYSLEKYLEDLSKAKDIRVPNAKYFQLSKYAEWDDPLEGVKSLYFAKQ